MIPAEKRQPKMWLSPRQRKSLLRREGRRRIEVRTDQPISIDLRDPLLKKKESTPFMVRLLLLALASVAHGQEMRIEQIRLYFLEKGFYAIQGKSISQRFWTKSCPDIMDLDSGNRTRLDGQ